MAYEYGIRIDAGDPALTESKLESILQELPDYFGKLAYPGGVAMPQGFS